MLAYPDSPGNVAIKQIQSAQHVAKKMKLPYTFWKSVLPLSWLDILSSEPISWGQMMNFAVFSHMLLWGSLEPQRGSSNLVVILSMRNCALGQSCYGHSGGWLIPIHPEGKVRQGKVATEWVCLSVWRWPVRQLTDPVSRGVWQFKQI